MQITLDKFGRILLPKVLRDDAGLQPGSVLEATSRNGAIQIQVAEESPWAHKEGVLIFTGEAIGNLEGALARHREERILRMAGGKD